MDDLLDFVARQGTSHIAATTGQRLAQAGPLPAERGALLIAGTARPGGFRPRCELLLSPVAWIVPAFDFERRW